MSKKVNYKVTNEQFLDALRKSNGLFDITASLIKELYNIDYTRQAVRERAIKYEEELQDIRDSAVDTAENKLLKLINSENENISLKAVMYYLDRIGTSRGYSQKMDLNVSQVEKPKVSPVPTSDEAIAKYQDLMECLDTESLENDT